MAEGKDATMLKARRRLQGEKSEKAMVTKHKRLSVNVRERCC